MEKIPGLRIVGDASEENKQEFKEKIENRFVNHIDSSSEKTSEIFNKFELTKSMEEIAILDFINSETNRLRQECGLDSFDIPNDNFHIVPPDLYKKVSNGIGDSAFVDPRYQGIILNEKIVRKNPVIFGSVAIHEALHLKSHTAFEVEDKTKDTYRSSLYRFGVSAHSSIKKNLEHKDHVHLNGLQEAIVANQQKKSNSNLLNIEILKEEKDRLNSPEVLALKKKISETRKVDISDIVWVGENEKEYKLIGYKDQRETLEYVCNEILKEFPSMYTSQDEIFNEFLRAQLTGQLLMIARLTESVFGEGSFRTLGDMGTDSQTAILCLESLQKARSRFLKNKKPE